MKRKQQSVVLAGLLALGLAACSSTGTSGSSSDMAGTTSSVTTGDAAQSTPAVGSTSTGSTATASAAMGQDTSPPAAVAVATPNGVVTLIEVVPRSGTSASSATGSSGTSGTTGTGGSASASDKVYRVTLLMDDGSTRVVTQESAPSFRSGDRVRMDKGMIQR